MVKKTVYIAPSMVVVNLGASDELLDTMSAGILGNGGKTSDVDFSEGADVKDDRGGFFDDEW